MGQHVYKKTKRPSYCRREAFRQAHSIMSSIDLDVTKELERKKQQERSQRNLNNAFGDSPTSNDEPIETKRGHLHSNSLPSTPDEMHHAQSMPNSPNTTPLKPRIAPAKVHFHKIQLVRHLSTPENDIYHSGAGHGGQAKGMFNCLWLKGFVF